MAMFAHSDLQIPNVFRIQRDDVAADCNSLGVPGIVEAALKALDVLSISFGRLTDKPVDRLFMDNPVWTRPLIKLDVTEWLLPLPTTMVRYCPDIFRAMCDSDVDLKASFADARAAILEQFVADAFRATLPNARIWPAVKWHDPDSNKDYENDTVDLFDRWLLLIEEKLGRIRIVLGAEATIG